MYNSEQILIGFLLDILRTSNVDLVLLQVMQLEVDLSPDTLV